MQRKANCTHVYNSLIMATSSVRTTRSVRSDHFCDLPVVEGAKFGDCFICPGCGRKWTLTIDENDEPCAYWDSE